MSEWNFSIPAGESIKLLTSGQYCDRDIVVNAEGGGGGGGGATLLYTAEITEPVSAIKVDVPEEWKDYQYIICVPDNLLPSTKEWLCFNPNVPGNIDYIGSGGSTSQDMFTFKHSKIIYISADETKCFVTMSNNPPMERAKADIVAFCFKPYYSQNTFNSGAIHFYGVML